MSCLNSRHRTRKTKSSSQWTRESMDSSQKKSHWWKLEQRLKKLLRQKLISCYDLGPVMELFDIIEEETLGPKDSHGEVILKAGFLQRKQKIFPFAVPHFRLPLLPSSRSELVKVSQVLTKCQLFPRQLQKLTESENRRKQDLKAACFQKHWSEVGEVERNS